MPRNLRKSNACRHDGDVTCEFRHQIDQRMSRAAPLLSSHFAILVARALRSGMLAQTSWLTSERMGARELPGPMALDNTIRITVAL
jgi:hypothetical protein